ncbi:MAG: metallophosphoesterase [Chitinophagaceae bacterium]|nr:metallophosphoesterase [Chitinophagaceae bacterium]MCW5928682.1 metallophosphoesterase [Chitinophagaceae bacterium]
MNSRDMNRKKFILSSLTFIAGTKLTLAGERRFNMDTPLRFGIVTDLHYADRAPAGSRHYKESFDKLSECVDLMNREKVDFLIELGDFKDQSASPDEKETLGFLETIESKFREFKGPVYHVLGNHDMDSISKDQFLNSIYNSGFSKAQSYYSFNTGGFHFVVLDPNYTREGLHYDRGNFDWKDCHIPEEQLSWLEEDLKRHPQPTVVFIHQQLDGPAFPGDHSRYCPHNADRIRAILEQSGNVLITFQGHYHDGGFNMINGIYYYTLKAVIEDSDAQNNSYAIVEIDKDMSIAIKGYRKAVSKKLVR